VHWLLDTGPNAGGGELRNVTALSVEKVNILSVDLDESPDEAGPAIWQRV